MGAIQIRKAVKQAIKWKIAIQGPSGSGKTLGALALAHNLHPNGKILVVDTENGSSELYADRYEFDVIPLTPPYTSEKYEAAIQAGIDAGYDVIIPDSISHQWDGDGGILRRKEEIDLRGGNSYTNWAKFTPEHKRFVDFILHAPVDIIATMRSKTEYVLEDSDKGKKVPRKVGMAPIQRDGVDYEFSIVFDVQLDHKALATKDRTSLFADQLVDLISPKTADAIKNWMSSAAPVVPVSLPTEKADVRGMDHAESMSKLGRWTTAIDKETGMLRCYVEDVLEGRRGKGETLTLEVRFKKSDGTETVGMFTEFTEPGQPLYEMVSSAKDHNCEFKLKKWTKGEKHGLNIVELVTAETPKV